MHDGDALGNGGRETDAVNGRRQDSRGESAGVAFAKKAKLSTQAEQSAGTEGGAGRERGRAPAGQTLHDAVPHVLMPQEVAKSVVQVCVPGLIVGQRLSARCLCLPARCRCLPADCRLSATIVPT